MTTLDPYWRDTLAEAESTRLPRYPASNLSDTDQVATHPVALPAALTRQLRDRAANTGVPLPSLILTAHLAVLGFLSDSEDLLTGYRDGTLTGPLPLRVRLDGGTWDDLLAQVDAVRQEVLAHADSGPERIAELAGGDGEWFETALVVTEGDVDCPFQVELSPESGAGGRFQIRYRERDFAADQIQRIGGYYQRALEHLCCRASENYRPYDLLAASEDALLRAWCGPDRPLGELTYLGLFERMAARRPDAIALECGERRLTYAELDTASQRVAWYCASQGVSRGDIVTTLLPRDLPWAVSALALLRMGAGYLPQHPDHPAERVAAALVRSGCRHVITDPELTGDLLAQLRERIPELLVLDVTGIEVGVEIDSAEVPRALPGDPAYVIFTSGSTGEPKGAVIPIRAC
jgi:non-ribosomal peptide synthetase component F